MKKYNWKFPLVSLRFPFGSPRPFGTHPRGPGARRSAAAEPERMPCLFPPFLAYVTPFIICYPLYTMMPFKPMLCLFWPMPYTFYAMMPFWPMLSPSFSLWDLFRANFGPFFLFEAIFHPPSVSTRFASNYGYATSHFFDC